MNGLYLTGRLTRDPDVRYGSEGNAVARFSIAIDRGKDRNGNDLGADFPTIVCFGKTAQLVEKHIGKGRLVGVNGKIHTGKYEKDGKTIYTTEVYAHNIEFLDRAADATGKNDAPKNMKAGADDVNAPEGFTKLDGDDIPF